tara:strand:- start:4751 stop:4924 length:174 start_codon:yes stop_codon:yes gene_type:complete
MELNQVDSKGGVGEVKQAKTIRMDRNNSIINTNMVYASTGGDTIHGDANSGANNDGN